ncbi:MAG: MazG family protein [Actinomycetota bacterium]|nr:MazG family protein [Actinomycetota bacterium]
MSLLVVPLAPDETNLLTLGELDELLSCKRVLFEQPQHPLRARLEVAGVECASLDEEPETGETNRALVADPGSVRVLELARGGARVSFLAAHPPPARPPDDLTAAHAAPILRRAAAALSGVVAVMARLRGEDGCPWDQEQTHESLKIHLLEEAHEVIEAIDSPESEDLAEELGDLLLQVVFHSRLAEQEGRFDVASVASALEAKLVLRHPHVFSDVGVSGAAEVLANWETIKNIEKGRSHPFDGIPRTLPALLKAAKMQKRAAALGFGASEQEARSRLVAALAPEASRESLGEALFWLVALARALRVDPEGALASHLDEFRASLPAP